MAGRTREFVLAWVAAGTLALVGLITVAAGMASPASFGWSAYAPLTDSTFFPGGDVVLVSRATVIGAIVCALGLIGLAFRRVAGG